MSTTTARSSLAVHNGGVSTICNGSTIFTQADALGTDALDTVITGLKNAGRPPADAPIELGGDPVTVEVPAPAEVISPDA